MSRLHLVIDGTRHDSTLAFGPKFGFDTLPEAEQVIAEPFAVCARAVIDALPDGVMLQSALVELLSARQKAIVAARAAGGVVVADGSRVLLEPANPIVSAYEAATKYDPARATADVPVETVTDPGTDRLRG